MDIPIYECESSTGDPRDVFKAKVECTRKPAILRGFDIGCCKDKWSADYLASQISGDKEVKLHVCKSYQMDFINKNFVYRSLPFGEFIKRASGTSKEFIIDQDEKYYLRALGKNPRKDIADIKLDFPELAEDVKLPDIFNPNTFFSSVFRIASPGMQLWTHYDVMDNALIQIIGRKRVVLFSPKDAKNLYLNGDKSEVLNIDNPDLERFPLFQDASPYTGELMAGDILYIPALWFHNVISLDFGVAVNVFWRHLDKKLYDQNDTYGNKDLIPAERAMQVLNRAIKILDELPAEYRDFYARRMSIKLESTYEKD